MRVFCTKNSPSLTVKCQLSLVPCQLYLSMTHCPAVGCPRSFVRFQNSSPRPLSPDAPPDIAGTIAISDPSFACVLRFCRNRTSSPST